VTRSFLLALIIHATAVGSADAALLRFTIASEVARVDRWTDASPAPEMIDISFTLDTLSGLQSAIPGATGCLQGFGASGAVFSNISVRADGRELWSAKGAGGGYGGQAMAGNCQSVAYSSYLSIRDDTNVFSGSDFFLLGGMPHEDFKASSDPMAELLMGFQGAAPFSISGEWGKLRGQAWLQCTIYDTANCMNVSAVPLPATAWMLGTALGALVLARKHRRT
jgi:hypothetical protein